MQVKKIILKKLYGNDYDVTINKDLTILHGVNGSGKTTILNIISQICSGEVEKVLVYEFQFLKIQFEKLALTIEVTEDTYIVKFDGITTEFPKETNKIRFQRERTTEFYTRQIKYRNNNVHTDKEYSEIEYPEEIKSINQRIKNDFELTYITLDRNVYGLDSTTNKYWYDYSKKIHFEENSIKTTLRLANEYYINYEESILRKEQRMQRALEDSLFEKMAEPINNINIAEPENKKINIGEIETILLEGTSRKVKRNIESLIKIYNENKQLKLDYLMKNKNNDDPRDFMKLVNMMVSEEVAYSQLEKLYDVYTSNMKTKRKIEMQKNKLKETTENINILLKDTHKKVLFNEKDGLYFKNLRTGKDLPLENLSSGEIQLVIFMVFSLIRNQTTKNQSKVILIDEPELSLHISWQEKILPLMTKYVEKTQMIIATHSPDIIGDMYDKCVEVSPNE